MAQSARGSVTASTWADSSTPPHTIVPMTQNLSCPVMTMHMLSSELYSCDEDDPKRRGSRVFRLRSVASGQAFAMVHQWNRAPKTVIRAVLCHHRHLLSVPRLQCEKATCFPVRDRSGRTPLLQAEVEVVAKFVSPGEWHNVCRGHNRTYLGECVTTEDEQVTLRGPS